MSAMPFATETFAPLWRARTYSSALYLLLALPIGLAAFIMLVTVGASLGAGLAIVWIGIPILLALLATSRAFAAFDRGLANRLLGTAIAAPAAQRSRGGSIWTQVKALVRAPSTWRSILWLALRFPLSLIAFTAPLALAATGVALIVAPFTEAFTGAHRIVAASGATAAICVVGRLRPARADRCHLVDGLAWLYGALARALLGPSRSEELARFAARSERRRPAPIWRASCTTRSATRSPRRCCRRRAARRVLDTDPAFVDEALSAIEAQGREALEELDRVLAVLRDEAGDTRPAPTLADVDELLARTRAAGQPLAVTRSGDLGRVPAAVGREAYRVLQEALTNVMRHASGAAATVSLAVGERSLDLSVDNGPGSAIDPGRSRRRQRPARRARARAGARTAR